MKKTLVVGASTNPDRYSYKAIHALRNAGHKVVALGLKPGKVADVEINTMKIPVENLHTVTLYVGPQHQPSLYEYIISLHPRRVIFNPGTENPEFEHLLDASRIDVQESCTLVLLSVNLF